MSGSNDNSEKLYGNSMEKRVTGAWSKVYFLGFSLYSISFGLIFLFAGSFFWDDWLNYFDRESSEVRGSLAFSGFNPLRLIFEGALIEVLPSGLQLGSFCCFVIAAVSLARILKYIPFLTNTESQALFLLFLLLPVNSARASMTIFMYSFSYASFFAGWWLFMMHRKWWTLIMSSVLFLLSFDTASFMLFMVVPLGVALLSKKFSLENILSWLKKNLVFILLPIAYWFVEPRLNPTLDATRLAYWTPTIGGVSRALLLGVSICVPFLVFAIRFNWRYNTHRSGIQVAVGLFITWLGMFPYMALGHFPNLNALLIGFVPGASDWDSRHQLLMPLGLGLVIVGVLNFLNPARLWAGVLVVCGLSTVLNLTFSQEYYLDSIKTQRIIEAFRSNPDVKEFDMALIDDQALRFNARGRAIRSYEWDYMLKAANPGLQQTTDVLRYVDCNVMDPDAIIVIQASNGKLETLLTRNPGITVSVQKISVCNK